MWNFSTQSALVAIIVSIATMTALLLRSRRKLNWRFTYFATAVSFFYSTLLLDTVFQQEIWLIHVRMVVAGIVLITATYFFDALMGEAGLVARERRRKTAFVGVVIVAIGLTPLALNLYVEIAASATIMLVLAHGFRRLTAGP